MSEASDFLRYLATQAVVPPNFTPQQRTAVIDVLDELSAVTAERDQARKAITSFGGGNEFDWGVLGRIDELESEVEALRITSPSAAEQADRVKPVDEAWLVATDWQPGDGSNYPLWRGMIQCSGPSMNLWWLVNERDNGTSDVIRIPWIKPTRGQVLDLMRALGIKAK